jgi:hypothetical protein
MRYGISFLEKEQVAAATGNVPMVFGVAPFYRKADGRSSAILG